MPGIAECWPGQVTRLAEGKKDETLAAELGKLARQKQVPNVALFKEVSMGSSQCGRILSLKVSPASPFAIV